MRTESAPTTALSGKNISEDALAISMAIFAASYAVPQRDSFDDRGSSIAVSVGSRGGGAVRKGIALVDGASTLGSLARGWIVVGACSTGSTTLGVCAGGRLFAGLADDEGLFRKRRMVDIMRTKCGSALPLRCWASRSEKLNTALTHSKNS